MVNVFPQKMAVLFVNIDIPLQGVKDFLRVERSPLGKLSRKCADAEEADSAEGSDDATGSDKTGSDKTDSDKASSDSGGSAKTGD